MSTPRRYDVGMKTPSDILTDFFTKTEWRFEADDARRCYHSRFTGENGRWSFAAIVSEEGDGILVLSFVPAIVAPGRRPACLDLLNRVNYQLLNGCFEMDADGGEVRFRTMLPVPAGGVSLDSVERLLGAHLQTVDLHYAAIMRVVYAGQSPTEALKTPSDASAPAPRFELN
jgi:hypothetical protein